MYRDAIKHFAQGPAAWANLGKCACTYVWRMYACPLLLPLLLLPLPGRVLSGEAATRRVLPGALGDGEEAGDTLAMSPNEVRGGDH